APRSRAIRRPGTRAPRRFSPFVRRRRAHRWKRCSAPCPPSHHDAPKIARDCVLSRAMLFGRADGDLVRDVPPYRRMMQLLMRRKCESTVYFEQELAIDESLAWLERANGDRAPEDRLNLFHLVLHAIVEVLAERPRLNRFTAGGRIYQRRGIWISFSAKKAMNDESPVFTVKRTFEPGRSVADTAVTARGGIGEGRGDKPTHIDNELKLLLF